MSTVERNSQALRDTGDLYLALCSSEELRRYHLPHLEAVQISVENKVSGDEAAIRAKLAELKLFSENGWLRCESAVGRLPAEAPTLDGVPLDGEWALDERRSLRLLYDGQKWRLIQITEVDIGGETVLKEAAHMTASPLAGKVNGLAYAVYWGSDSGDPSGLRRLACRFVGFVD